MPQEPMPQPGMNRPESMADVFTSSLRATTVEEADDQDPVAEAGTQDAEEETFEFLSDEPETPPEPEDPYAALLDGLPEEKATAIRETIAELESAKATSAQVNEHAQLFGEYVNALQDERQAPQTLRYLADQVASYLGMPLNVLAEKMGFYDTTLESDQSEDDEYGEEFQQGLDPKKISQIVDEAVKKAVAPFMEERAKAQEAQARTERANTVMTQVNTHFKPMGIRFTANQIAEAVANIPSLEGKPVEACERWYGKQIAEWKERSRSRTSARSPHNMSSTTPRIEEDTEDIRNESIEAALRRSLRKHSQA